MLSEICEEDLIDDKINELKDKALPDDISLKLSNFLKIFSDSTRIKIIHLLSLNEICVHEIASILDVSQSGVSHQLKLLRLNNVVTVRKEGKHIYYSLKDEHVVNILKNSLSHIDE